MPYLARLYLSSLLLFVSSPALAQQSLIVADGGTNALAFRNKTGKVATFGGLAIPSVTSFMDGYWEGVQYYNEQNGKQVEVLGWDEAFVGPGPGHGDLGEPEAAATAIRDAVLAATGLHCSVGIGDNKLRAKIATDFGKPRGTYRLTVDTWFDVMGARPTGALWGIGAKTAKKLAALGIETVADLAGSDARLLADQLGPTMGPWYHRLGRGVGDTVVDATPWVPRAHGREETFQVDLEDRSEVDDAVRRLTARVVEDIDREGRPAVRVGLKVRFRPFVTFTRSLTLPGPTNDVAVLAEAAVSLLDRLDDLARPGGPGPGEQPSYPVRPVRLLGVRLEMADPAEVLPGRQ